VGQPEVSTQASTHALHVQVLLMLALSAKTIQPTKKWGPGKPKPAYHKKPAKLPQQAEKLTSWPTTASQAQRSRGGEDRKLWQIISNSIILNNDLNDTTDHKFPEIKSLNISKHLHQFKSYLVISWLNMAGLLQKNLHNNEIFNLPLPSSEQVT
jgi:hypothetical protein